MSEAVESAATPAKVMAAYERLAIEMVQGAVETAGTTEKKAEREKEIAFLSDLSNSAYLMMGVGEGTAERIVNSIPDNSWY